MFGALRNRFHPLFYLRRAAWFSRVSAFLAFHFDIPIFVRIEGISFPVCLRLIPQISIVMGRAGSLETSERANFRALVKERRPKVFWDIGANFGVYSLDFLSLTTDACVIALEPDNLNAKILRKTALRSSLKMTVLEAAASSENGLATFYYDDMTSATGTLTPQQGLTFNERYHKLKPRIGTVSTVRLDDLLRDYPPPDFLKVDTEGNELAVFDGARQLLTEYKPVILFEMGGDRKKTFSLLRDIGYRLLDARTMETVSEKSWNIVALPEGRG